MKTYMWLFSLCFVGFVASLVPADAVAGIDSGGQEAVVATFESGQTAISTSEGTDVTAIDPASGMAAINVESGGDAYAVEHGVHAAIVDDQKMYTGHAVAIDWRGKTLVARIIMMPAAHHSGSIRV